VFSLIYHCIICLIVGTSGLLVVCLSTPLISLAFNLTQLLRPRSEIMLSAIYCFHGRYVLIDCRSLLTWYLMHFPVPCRCYVQHRFILNTSHVPIPLLPLIFHILIMKLRITKYTASRMYMQCRVYKLLEFNSF